MEASDNEEETTATFEILTKKKFNLDKHFALQLDSQAEFVLSLSTYVLDH
jgi:hypothetical protein